MTIIEPLHISNEKEVETENNINWQWELEGRSLINVMVSHQENEMENIHLLSEMHMFMEDFTMQLKLHLNLAFSRPILGYSNNFDHDYLTFIKKKATMKTKSF